MSDDFKDYTIGPEKNLIFVNGFGKKNAQTPIPPTPNELWAKYIESQKLAQNPPVATGVKHDQGKPRTDLLPARALMEVAKVLEFGGRKYGDHNWRGGLKYSRLVGAALRHIFSWLGGEDNDPETGLCHISHAACCCLMLLEFCLRGKSMLDDRYTEPNPGSPKEGK